MPRGERLSAMMGNFGAAMSALKGNRECIEEETEEQLSGAVAAVAATAEKTDKRSLKKDLIRAIQQNSMRRVKELINRVDVYTRLDRDGSTALHFAAALKTVNIAQFLIGKIKENGVFDLVKNLRGETPFDIACEKGNWEMIQLFSEIVSITKLKDRDEARKSTDSTDPSVMDSQGSASSADSSVVDSQGSASSADSSVVDSQGSASSADSSVVDSQGSAGFSLDEVPGDIRGMLGI